METIEFRSVRWSVRKIFDLYTSGQLLVLDIPVPERYGSHLIALILMRGYIPHIVLDSIGHPSKPIEVVEGNAIIGSIVSFMQGKFSINSDFVSFEFFVGKSYSELSRAYQRFLEQTMVAVDQVVVGTSPTMASLFRVVNTGYGDLPNKFLNASKG